MSSVISSFLALIVIVKFGCMVNMGNSSSSSSSSSSRLPRDDSYYDDNNIPADVSIACIKAHLKSGVPAQEFMRLEHNAPWGGTGDTSITEAQRICNKEKNRYVNILPCDSTRVRLAPIAGVDGSDYINANFIDGIEERAYIATQGPLPHTRGDFWRMVWENNSTIVVMLGKERENERVKVDRYWPEEGEGTLHFAGLSVALVSRWYDQDGGIAVRRLRLRRTADHDHARLRSSAQHRATTHEDSSDASNSAEVREVIHYQYEGWPDHGVPESAAPIRKLVRIIEHERSLTPQPQPSPMIVHCSAGVGRTGTFVTIHMTLLRLFHELNSNGGLNHSTSSLAHSSSSTSLSHSTSSLDRAPSTSNLLTARFNLYDTVLKLRRQRPGMVQQQEQYIFCYEAVAEEAEHLGLIPGSPVLQRRSPRSLSISTSSLPSPSSSSNIRTSSSSYISSPTNTSIPASPGFLDSSGFFLNSSTASLPSPPSSPYIHTTSLDCSTPSLFPPHESIATSVDCRK